MRAQEAGQRHARDLDGGLEGEEEAGAGALVGGEVGDVLAVEGDGALRNGVDRVAHDDVAHGGFTGTVGAHEDVGLACADGEVDALEDGLFVHGGGEAGDVEQGCCAHIKSFRDARARLRRVRQGARPVCDPR